MTSKIALCNQALANIKAEALIETLDESVDDSEEVRYCNIYYDQLRKQVLRDHEWGCATRYVTLTLTNTTPLDTRWNYMYQRPSGYLRIQKIVNPADANVKIEYEQENHETEGRVILTNQEDAIAKMTIDLEDVSEFDDDLFNALSWLLASHIAGPIGAGSNWATKALQMYNSMVGTAEATDSNEQEDGHSGEVVASWTSARL